MYFRIEGILTKIDSSSSLAFVWSKWETNYLSTNLSRTNLRVHITSDKDVNKGWKKKERDKIAYFWVFGIYFWGNGMRGSYINSSFWWMNKKDMIIVLCGRISWIDWSGFSLFYRCLVSTVFLEGCREVELFNLRVSQKVRLSDILIRYFLFFCFFFTIFGLFDCLISVRN